MLAGDAYLIKRGERPHELELSLADQARRRPLERSVDELRTVIVQLRRDLTNKTRYATRLEYLLRSRTERIDELANTIAVLREQKRRLDEEAERYAQMVALAPAAKLYSD